MGRPQKKPTPADKLAMADRRAKVAELYLSGVRSQADIAREVGCHQSTVGRDIAWVKEAHGKAAVEYYGRALAEELAAIWWTQRQATEAWERSKQDAVTTRKGKTSQGKVDVTTASGQAGDPRFLAIVLDCIERRCKLLGLDSPEQVNFHLAAGEVVNQSPREVRDAILDEPDYLEFARARAADADAGPDGAESQPAG